MFSINRLTYSRVYDGNTCDDTCIDNSLAQLSERERRRNSGKPLQHMDSGQRTAIRRQRAIGKSSIPSTTTSSLAFTDVSSDTTANRTVGNVIRSAQRRVRSGGAVAPPKKGANTSFKSAGGGGCC